MRLTYVLPFLSLSLALTTVGCNNEPKQQAATEVHNEHDGHDHSAHAETSPSTAAPAPQQAPPTVKAANLSIPEFTFFKVKSGVPFSKADIAAGRNTVFILFDPSCAHCQHEATALSSNYDKIKGVNIYYVSMNDPALMANFFNTFGKELEGKPNVEMLYDRNQEFVQRIHIPKMFPANYVYGPDGSLKKYWEGEKDIKEVIADFNN